jgi:ferric-dicitrate binding protein FerR (iron transport regulator)
MNQDSPLDELIERHLRGELTDPEKERLAEWLDSDLDARKKFVELAQWDTRFADALREAGAVACETRPVTSERATIRGERSSANTSQRLLLSASAVVIVFLAGGLFYQQTRAERRIAEIIEIKQLAVPEPVIAKVIGLSGSLVWTGDRGQIEREIRVGTNLAGGTIEGTAPDSWFELEFNDGSTMMISGNSMLTFADHGQKSMRLKEGNFSANVVSQPAGKPMLIHTPSARLEVLGTQFEVEAGLSFTTLNVSQGRVRVKRLSDGSTVDVPAKHRVVATVDRDLLPVRVPDSVHRWRSQLGLGPQGTYGKWMPASNGHAAHLKAIPMVPAENPKDTLYMLAKCVSRSASSPVILQPGSRFVVRGRVSSAAGVYFGIAMVHPNGEFGGKFRADKPAADFDGQTDFEAEFELSEFALDPCVRDRKDELPGKPEGLIVTAVWCFTVDRKVGATSLEVTEIELIPPEENGASQGK